jgi:hypothetical protein
MWGWWSRLTRAEKRIDELNEKIRELDKRVLFLYSVVNINRA